VHHERSHAASSLPNRETFTYFPLIALRVLPEEDEPLV
jgi:hypothetical protein